MALEKYFPFRSVAGDRKYSAEDWAAYFAQFLSDGVFYNNANNLKVVANDAMKITVNTGAGFVVGRMYVLEREKVLTIETADGVVDRIDRIVLRCDYINRLMGVDVIKGNYSATPTAPELTRNADVYELALADVYVAAGAIEITNANITDQRLNTSLCGIVTGLVEQADTTEIFNQFQEYLEEFKETSEKEFTYWFESIKAVLDKETIGELLEKLNRYVTPEMFGAIGDGITDDTEAFKKAFESLTNGGLLKIYTGEYLITESLDVPNNVMIEGIAPKISLLKIPKNNFEGNYILKFANASNGGGVRNLSIYANENENVKGVIIGEEGNNSVQSGFEISHLVMTGFRNNAIEYRSGWQATLHDIYASGKNGVGLLIKGADTTLHDLNISGFTTALFVNTGTCKISNIKIDGSITGNDYACKIIGSRNQITNIEIQYCKPNGVYIAGEYNTINSMIIDGIGKGVDDIEEDTGYSLVIGSVRLSKMDVKIIPYGNTKLIGYDYEGNGNILEDYATFYHLTNTSKIEIFSDVQSPFTVGEMGAKYVLHNLQVLKELSGITSPKEEKSLFEYDEGFNVKINENTVPNIGNYKAMIVEADIVTTGNISLSIYEGAESVVKQTLKICNRPYKAIALLNDDVTNFNVYFSSTSSLKLVDLKITLFEKIEKYYDIFV